MPGSQKFSENFHWKILSNFLMVSDVSLEMQSDSKNYVGLQDDEITEPVHTIKSACAWHLQNLRLHRKLEIFNELLQKASFEPNEKMRCFFGTAKRFLKLLWICSGQIRQPCAYHKITAHWFLSDCRSRSQIDSVNVHWVRGRNVGSFPEQRLEIKPNRGQWMVWFKYYIENPINPNPI